MQHPAIDPAPSPETAAYDREIADAWIEAGATIGGCRGDRARPNPLPPGFSRVHGELFDAGGIYVGSDSYGATIVRMRLNGATLHEIADHVDRSVERVRSVLRESAHRAVYALGIYPRRCGIDTSTEAGS